MVVERKGVAHGGPGGGGGNTNNSKKSKPPSSSISSSSSTTRGPNPQNSWYHKRRNSGIKVHRKKPPQWEKEGDSLYQEIVHNRHSTSSSSLLSSSTNHNQKITYGQAKELLTQVEVPLPEQNNEDTGKEAEIRIHNDHGHHDDENEESSSPYLWGGLSVGPVWKTRLLQAGFVQPTLIQREAFLAIASNSKDNQNNNNNVILASPTGSGKSLAYLLPLLAASGKKVTGRVWIVTPTMELARQLQRVVQNLALPSSSSSSIIDPILHVVVDQEDPDTTKDPFPLLSRIAGQAPMMVAGTPQMLQQLWQEIESAKTQRTARTMNTAAAAATTTGEETMSFQKVQTTALALSNNLQTVVLDEADRLLQTEAVARNVEQRRQQKELQQEEDPSSPSKATSRRSSRRTSSTIRRLPPSPTEELLQKLLQSAPPSPSNRNNHKHHNHSPMRNLQIICASATVGRTLRRQLMQIVQAPSMDKAALLVTDHVRTKKDAIKRKSSLLPSTLQHAYRLLPENDPTNHHQPNNNNNDDDDPHQQTLHDVWETMQGLEPAPTLIFPGRIGVHRVQQELRIQRGFQDVRSLEDEEEERVATTTMTTTTITPANDDDHNNLVPTTTPSTTTSSPAWETTPVFVVGEKFGRGLDVLQGGIRYVMLLQVPSSAAGYTHLAGRTGRNGSPGTAISFCQPREVPKLVTIAETLGITLVDVSRLFLPTSTTNTAVSTPATTTATTTTTTTESPPSMTHKDATHNVPTKILENAGSWATLSESSLKRKTIAEITEYLADYGISVTNDDTGKKATKASLLLAVQELHPSTERTL